ncbi:MAG: hypothetical protein CM1200mP14_29090 [Gammaproteobacteria bacterium]|nr:MAG: hypothetical protein CM1200mP14_29090 [Gammaproteobacteria bacterium]
MLWVVKRNDASNGGIKTQGGQEVLFFLSSKEPISYFGVFEGAEPVPKSLYRSISRRNFDC